MSKSTEASTPFELSPQKLAEFENLVERYPTRQSVLMPALWLIQDEYGHVSDGAVDFLVEKLEVTPARVREIISFYTMYRDEPQAKHVLQVCHNISCHVMGARGIIAHLEKRLGIRLGEKTPDGTFSIEGAECLGACGHGPVMQVGRHLYEFLTPEKVDEILESFKKGEPLRPDTDRELEE